MAKKGALTSTYEALPPIVKIVLQIFFGYLIGGVYRIVRFVENGNVITLVAGILVLVTGIGNVLAWIIDLWSQITKSKLTVLVD